MSFHKTNFRMGGNGDLTFGSPSVTSAESLSIISNGAVITESKKFSLESDVNVPFLGIMKVKTLLLLGVGLFFIFGMR